MRAATYRRLVELASCVCWLAAPDGSLLLSLVGAGAGAESRLVRIEGKSFIAPDGSTLHIKGISLGNWLMPEGYMFKFEVAKSPRQIYGAFDRLLGPERAQAFWRQFRERYIAEDDIRFIKSVGFNTVRIPLHWDLFMTADGAMTGAGWALLDRVLGWVRAAGLYAIVDLHAAPGGQTGINHDDGPGYPLMFYVPRDRDLTVEAVAGDRPALCRRSGDPGLRHPERADRALSRHGDAQSAARAVLQGGDDGDPRGRSRPHRDPGRRAVELELRHVRPALRRQPRLHLSFVLGEHEAQFDPAPSQLLQPLQRAAVPRRDRRADRRMERRASASCTRRTASAGRSGPTRTSTRPRPWSRSRGPRAGTRSWPSPTARTTTKPSDALIDRAMAQYLDGMRLPNATVRWSYLESLGLKAAP